MNKTKLKLSVCLDCFVVKASLSNSYGTMSWCGACREWTRHKDLENAEFFIDENIFDLLKVTK